MTRPRVAIAHDYLTQRGGAERVVLSLTRAFPGAAVYTTLYEPQSTYPEFEDVDVRVSWLNAIGPLRRHHRAALPLLPFAASSVYIDADVVVASSSGWAHGFRTSGRKLVYCYAPARWLYEPNRYLGDNASPAIRGTLSAVSPWLRRWDARAAESADEYVAISSVTRGRIQDAYGRVAPVVPAPHQMDTVGAIECVPGAGPLPSPGYFLLVSRLLPYKNVSEVVQAFALRPDQRLVVLGRGPQKAQLVAAAPSNVTFLEDLSDLQVKELYARCVGLVAASHEDFGLTPLEAAAFGKPSAVLRWGGFLDTVVEGQTGVFFDEPSPEAIGSAVDRLLVSSWNAQRLRERASEFNEDRFIEEIRRRVDCLARSTSTK